MQSNHSQMYPCVSSTRRTRYHFWKSPFWMVSMMLQCIQTLIDQNILHSNDKTTHIQFEKRENVILYKICRKIFT